MGRTLAAACLIALGIGLSEARAADWPMWGGNEARNMAAAGVHLPDSFVPGEKKSDGSGIDLATTKNVRWVARLGSENYSTPTIAGGRVFIGTNDAQIGDPKYKSTEGGLLLCLDEATGKVLWRLVMPKCEAKHKSTDFDEMDLGVCGAVTVDGDRAYVLNNRCEVLCMDIHGMANGNDGPFTDEAHYCVPTGQPPVTPGPTDGDLIWRFDVIKELNAWPHDAAVCAVLVHGDLLYVGTSNGVDNEKPAAPEAPSLIVLDKRTGRLVGRDDEKVGARVYHGQWSSPAFARIGGKDLVIYGAGDGVCYAFEAFDRVPEKPRPLTKVWSFRCNPPEFLARDGKPIDYWHGDKRKKLGNNDDGKYVGPNEIIATPVVHRNRVYVATGQDPVHGRGRAVLNCIDATQTGDVSVSGRIWSYDQIDRSMSTVSIADGLLYIADRPGTIHCLDPDTGKPLWTYNTKADIWGSTFAADGKLYVPSRKYLFVLAQGRTAKLLAKIRLGSPVWATPVVANDTLYIASQNYFWAIGGKE